MNQYVKPIIMTDSCSDLPDSYYEENEVPRVKLSYIDGEKSYFDNGLYSETDAFYQMQIAGAAFSTSQVTVSQFLEKFNELAALNRPIIYLAFSAVLSASYQSACTAAEMLQKEMPEVDITIVNSKAASIGLGLFVWHVIRLRDEEKSKEEILSWIEENMQKVNHWFSVEDLSYLQKGGRVSAATAFFGNMLGINPLLWVDKEGRLMPVAKERGRKKVMKAIVAHLLERIEDPENQTIFVAHGYCPKDAEDLKAMIEEKIKVKAIQMHRIGPIIGAHCGPSVLSVFFMGKARDAYPAS